MSKKTSPASKKRVFLIFLIPILLLAAAFFVELFVLKADGHSWLETLPGRDLIFGFCGSWLLILFAKKILARIIQKPENYYEQPNVSCNNHDTTQLQRSHKKEN